MNPWPMAPRIAPSPLSGRGRSGQHARRCDRSDRSSILGHSGGFRISLGVKPSSNNTPAVVLQDVPVLLESHLRTVCVRARSLDRQLPAKPSSFSQSWEKEADGGMEEGRKFAASPPASPSISKLSASAPAGVGFLAPAKHGGPALQPVDGLRKHALDRGWPHGRGGVQSELSHHRHDIHQMQELDIATVFEPDHVHMRHAHRFSRRKNRRRRLWR